MKPSIRVSFAALPYIHLHPLPHHNLHQFLSVYSRTYPQMIFNYMPAHPFLSLPLSLVWLSFCLPALSEQTFNLLTGPVKAFLITKVAALSLPWPASPHATTQPPPHPPVNQLVRQSMTSLIWHLLDLPSLFIHPSCPTVLLSHCSLSLSLYLSLPLTLSEVLLQLYQSPFSLANQINSHSQSNRNPSKASTQSSMMLSKVQGRPPQRSPRSPLPVHRSMWLCSLCGVFCVGSALGCTLLISWPHIARHS